MTGPRPGDSLLMCERVELALLQMDVTHPDPLPDPQGNVAIEIRQSSVKTVEKPR